MSKEKQKGTAWETAQVEYLKDDFPHAKRELLNGANDIGDLDLFSWTCVQSKNQQRMALAEWLDAANQQGKRRGSWLNVVWHKRPRKASPGDGYVTMSGSTFKRVLAIIQTVYDEANALEQVVKILEEL